MKQLLIILLLFAAGCSGNDKQATPESPATAETIEGERLFKNNCASCHKPDKDFTGPALKGSLQRWGDKKAMYAFIRNPGQSVTENAYAKKVYEKWNKTSMTAFKLTDAEIDAIMNYVEKFSTNPVQ